MLYKFRRGYTTTTVTKFSNSIIMATLELRQTKGISYSHYFFFPIQFRFSKLYLKRTEISSSLNTNVESSKQQDHGENLQQSSINVGLIEAIYNSIKGRPIENQT